MAARKNILTACFAAVLAFGLAACGGGADERPEGPDMAVVTAAMAAERARDAAAATTDPRMAEEEQGKAEVALATANTERGAVGDLLTLANVAADAIETVAIAAARGKAEEYSDEATSHYESAKMKATDARGEANDAQAAATRAKGARTDYANAKKYADIADANADAAEAARDAAETAKNAAMTAYMAAMAATTSMDAEAERDKAKAQNDIATTQHTGDDDDETTVGAGENYKAAKAAAGKAEMYAGMHVISLLIHANAQDLELADEEEPDLAASVKRVRSAHAGRSSKRYGVTRRAVSSGRPLCWCARHDRQLGGASPPSSPMAAKD